MDHDPDYNSNDDDHPIDHGNIYADRGYRHRVFLPLRDGNKPHNDLHDTDCQHNKDNESLDHFEKNFDCVCDYSNDTSDLLRNTIDYAN
jgi:hypothetical protein